MRFLIGIILSVAVLHTAAWGKAKVPEPVQVEALPPDTVTRPVRLSKIVVDLNRGAPIGKVKGGLICLMGEPLVWRSGRAQINPEEFNDIFKEELEKLGFDAISESSNLFVNDEENRAEFLVGGRIKSIHVDACLPNSGLGDVYSAKGLAIIEVDWQIYDRLNRKVVDQHTTRTGAEQKSTIAGGLDAIVVSAFAENVRALVASGKLQKVLVGAPTDLNIAKKPNPEFGPLTLSVPVTGGLKIDDAVGATVLVQSGEGHGSGFLVSKEGYFLTNQHVVGAAKYVKIRWSDRIESLGEVVRFDRGRDVALIKSESRDRTPISVRGESPKVGEEVYAIGAPLEKELQNTVTKGIISATRVLDGYSYVQSDVSVVPGNSGGPLIDAGGRLVGITVAGFRINDAPQGVNLFIPAKESMEFLNLKTN